MLACRTSEYVTGTPPRSRASSGQYQILQAPVTSYCHCSSTLPLMVRVPRSLLNLCCLLALVRSRRLS
jgi:hypothetical protein